MVRRAVAPLLLLLLRDASAFGRSQGKEPGERQLALLTRESPPAGSSSHQKTKYAVFAAGCFWGVELAFARLPGVLHTDVGYTGGHTASPSYRDVTTGRTGHAEAVRVGYDPTLISYAELLGVLFDCHDSSTLNRQGNDVGTQYRSAIFYATDDEKQAAQAAVDAEKSRTGKVLATTLEALDTFYAAEDYHQHFLVKGGQSGAKGETTPIRCYG
mmetsp:Transcript_52614/g.138362  ORF Transcript_52614/g.138362 Transcript_52614/m.138362 type:complete len:214 (+) Transcript_52614:8-649(+)